MIHATACQPKPLFWRPFRTVSIYQPELWSLFLQSSAHKEEFPSFLKKPTICYCNQRLHYDLSPLSFNHSMIKTSLPVVRSRSTVIFIRLCQGCPLTSVRLYFKSNVIIFYPSIFIFNIYSLKTIANANLIPQTLWFHILIDFLLLQNLATLLSKHPIPFVITLQAECILFIFSNRTSTLGSDIIFLLQQKCTFANFIV